MFKEIFLFELKQNLRKPSIYIYFSVFFLLNLFVGLAVTGFFNTTRSDSNIIFNSPLVIASTFLGSSSNLFGLIGNVLLINIMSTSIQKDYEYNTHPLFFTKPITKAQYFFGRFLSSYFICVLIYCGLLVGFFCGLLQGIGTDYVGDFSFSSFFNVIVIFLLPNVFLFGTLFFSLTTFLRNTSVAYIVAIVLLVIDTATGTLSSNLENKSLAALLEPSGAKALGLLSEYWGPDEKNTKSIPLNGILFQNRLLWLSIAFLITAFSYYKFNFSQFLQPLNLFKSKGENKISEQIDFTNLSKIPKVNKSFTFIENTKRTWLLGVFEFKKLSTSVFFIIMLILSVGLIILQLVLPTNMFDTETYLVTYKAIDIVQICLGLAFIFILFYSGTIVWREKETRVIEFVGSSPISNGSLFLSKFIGLNLAVLSFAFLACLFGIGLQIYNGFYAIDFSQYLYFMISTLLSTSVTIALLLSVQIFCGNKYIGFFVNLVLIALLPILYSLLEWDSFLLRFNGDGDSSLFSDMNKFGNTFIQLPHYRILWMSITAALAMIASLAIARGKDKNLIARFKLSAYSFTKKYVFGLVSLFIIFIATAGFIAYEEYVLVDAKSSKENEKEIAEYEKKFKKYERLLQPRIIATKVNVDIFTEKQELGVKGTYTLKNKNKFPIDTLYIDYTGGEKSRFHYSKLEPVTKYKIVDDNKIYGIKIIKLDNPLQPNDSIDFSFSFHYKAHSYYDLSSALYIVPKNGTFINNNLFPSFGYNEQNELSQNKARIEYGLKPKERMASVNDSAAMMNTYISNDADWINFEAIVSTDEGQTAIAPGYLQKDWKKDGRHYFHYKMDSPILNFYSFLSAKYEIKKDKWNNVNLEIYYHKGHEFNIDRMMKAMKKSLEYYTQNFSPYQHKQLRIIEFPRYASFAQSFPNTIPFSESMGFIMKVDEKDPLSIDVPFYVTAHEVAHQWWAHQVIGANVQGSVLMSETMSEYSALMVMEKEYGKDAMKKFLKYEMDNYLQGRTFENKKEMPLMLVENQQYIHYNKGSVVMYALKDYIGEENLNKALKEYISKVKFQEPPYTTALEFLNFINKATPDSLKYLVNDMFSKITLYENYVKKLDYKQNKDGKYTVNLTVASAKFYADEKGKLTKASVNDYFDIGVFSSENVNGKEIEKPLIFERVKIGNKEQTFTFIVSKKPFSAGIDPYLKLIDRTPKNNTCKFGSKPETPNLSEKSDKLNILFSSEDE